MRPRTWPDRIAEVVARKLGDARAHAARAVTQGLIDTPDGRPSLARVRRSPSYRAALARLDELLSALAGPTVRSLEGMLRDARAEQYHLAYRRWLPRIPDAYRVPRDAEPTARNLDAARVLVLHGLDLRSELTGPVERAKRALGSAVVLAGSRLGAGQGSDLLDSWQRASQAAIGRAALLAWGDAEVALDRIAGRDLIRPELRDDSALALTLEVNS